MARLLTLRRALARLLTPDEVDDNIVNVATDFQGAVDPATLAGANVLPFMRWADTGTGWVRRRNATNDAWVNEQRLHRASLAIFDPDEIPAENVGPICIVGKGYAEWDDVDGGYRLESGRPVGTPDWWPQRSSIPSGQIPLDGQTVSRATFPDLTALVVAGHVPVVSESDWSADPTKRGAYTLGDGSTTIRVPDFNGKSAGALGAVFRRGDGAMSAGTEGLIQRDAFQGHTFGTPGAPLGTYGVNANGLNPGGLSVAAMRGDNASAAPIMTNGANGTPRIASETRSLNVAGVWTVHAFGAVVNPGSVDAAQLASDYATLSGSFQSSKSKLDTLWDGTMLNLMPGGRFVEGNFDGLHTSSTMSFRQGQPSTSVTYLPIVPPTGGNSAYTICRNAANENSAFVALGINGNTLFGELTFSRHGSAGIPGALRILSANTECGRIGADGAWIFGPYMYVPTIQARTHVYHTGGSLQYGMVFRPQLFENSVAVQFQAYNGAVAGYIQSNSNLSTQYATTSDYRSKTVLGEVDSADAMARVMQMRPVHFRMNGAAVVTRPLTGFVAHELQEVEHQAVTGHKDQTREDEDGETVPVMQGVDLSKIVPTLVAAIQHQQKRIDELTQEVQQLREQLSA